MSDDTSENIDEADCGQRKEGKGRIQRRQKQELKALVDKQKRELAGLKSKEGKKKFQQEHNLLVLELQRRHGEELQLCGTGDTSMEASDDKGTPGSQTQGTETPKPQESMRVRNHMRMLKRTELKEARMAKEVASNGPSLKDQEEADVKKRLLTHGLELETVGADGHCLYRALEHQLRNTQCKKAHSYQLGLAFGDLRKLAAQFLRQHRDEFEELAAVSEDYEGEYETYCTGVEETAKWGTEIEIRALSCALCREVVVHGALDNPDVTYGCEYGAASGLSDIEDYAGAGETLHIVFQKFYLSLGAHFNSTRWQYGSNAHEWNSVASGPSSSQLKA